MKPIKDKVVSKEKLLSKTTKSSYEVWRNLKQRCLNPVREEYKHYGGRGIGVSKEWLDFENFFRGMGERPSGLQLDRIDNSKGYSKDNCRWVSPRDNSFNKRPRNNKILQLPIGVTKNHNRFTARIQIEKFTYHIGSYLTPCEAHQAFRVVFHEWYGFYPKKGED